MLAVGLQSSHCKLEILNLSGCQVTEKGCSFLATALKTKMVLKQLDLSYNHPGGNGLRRLSVIAGDPNTSLKTLCLNHCGAHRLKPGLKKYGVDLNLDENTAGSRLVLSDGNRKVKTIQKVTERVERPENDVRFKRSQVLCEEGLKGLCYWEVEWTGTVGIAVAYRTVGRSGDSQGGLGCNEKSWSLLCSRTQNTATDGKTSKDVKSKGKTKGLGCSEKPQSLVCYTAIHGNTSIKFKFDSNEVCHKKVAVFLDWEGGTLTYYNVTPEKLSHIHTFHAKFTEPLFPSFWFKEGSVTLA